MRHITLLLALFLHSVSSLPSSIKIGGLFDMTDTIHEIAFRYAVDRINNDREILPRTQLTAQIERIPPQDSFYASKRVCKALSEGLGGIFGPQSGVTSTHVQSICDSLEVPHVETRYDYRLTRDDYSINLYPHPHALGQAFVDLVSAMKWKKFTVLYEKSEGLVRLQDVLKLSSENKDMKITIRQLVPGSGGDYRPLLKSMKTSGETQIILDCQISTVPDVLKQAQQVGIMTAYHSYLITSLDLHTVELEDFKYGGTNITAFRLVDPTNEVIKSVVQDWVLGELRFGRKIPFPEQSIRPNSTIHPNAIATETALVYDAVHLFARALTDLDRSQNIQISRLDCVDGEPWQHGTSLLNYMKMVETEGLTGKIQFDSKGFRSNFDLEIIELKKDGLYKVGVWNKETGANFTRNFTEAYSEIVESLHNKTLVITTILEPHESELEVNESSGPDPNKENEVTIEDANINNNTDFQNLDREVVNTSVEKNQKDISSPSMSPLTDSNKENEVTVENANNNDNLDSQNLDREVVNTSVEENQKDISDPDISSPSTSPLADSGSEGIEESSSRGREQPKKPPRPHLDTNAILINKCIRLLLSQRKETELR